MQPFSHFSEFPGVTVKGRELIQDCNKRLEDTYNASIVYTDDDSTMVKLPFINSLAECCKWGERLEKELSTEFPDPLYFELEYCADMDRSSKFDKTHANITEGSAVEDGNLPGPSDSEAPE